MPVIIPKIEVKVEHFRDFCYQFNVQTDKIAGNDGYDIELIIEELNKFKGENWVVSFIDDKQDGYFNLQRIN